MNREETLVQFQREAADPLCREARKAFYQLLQKKEERWKEKLLEGFEEIVKQVWRQEGEETEIAAIQISYLRSGILDGSYTWYFEAHKKDGIWEEEFAVSCTMAEFFLPYEQLEQELKKKMRLYFGKIEEMDIEQIKQNEIEHCCFVFYLIGLQTFRFIFDNFFYQKLKKAPLFRIFLGEYKGKGQMIHLTDTKLKKEMLLSYLLEKPEEEGEAVCLLEKEELTKRDFRNINLTGEKILMKNLLYSIWRNSRIQKSFFVCCNFMGVDFSEAELEDSFFQVCLFQNANFEGAKMKMVGFIGSHFKKGEQEGERIEPGLYAVSFQNSVLDGVDFSYADLSGCDFRKAKISRVIWKEAILKGAQFDEKTAEELAFSD